MNRAALGSLVLAASELARKRLRTTMMTILTVILSAMPAFAQGDLYAPINAPIRFDRSAAQVLADLYDSATHKSSRPTDTACLFGHVVGDSLVITRVLPEHADSMCRTVPKQSDYIGAVAFDDGSKVTTEAEARTAWMSMCDALQDNVGAYLLAVVYGIVLTTHAGPTPSLWGCYRLLPSGKAPLHVLK